MATDTRQGEASTRDAGWLGRAVALVTGWASVAAGGLLALDWALADVALLGPALQGRSAPIGPTTSLGVATLGVAILALVRGAGRVATASAGLVAVLGVVAATAHLLGAGPVLDRTLFGTALRSSGPPLPGNGSRLPTIALTILSAAAILLVARGRLRRGQVVAGLVLVVSGVAGLAHLYGASPYYEVSGYVVVSEVTALLFALLAVAVVGATAGRGLLRVLAAPPPAALLVRGLPAVVLVLVALTAIAQVGERRGWYDESLGHALATTATAAILTVLLLATARSLAVLDERRATAITSLQALTETLDEQVRERTASLEAEVAERARTDEYLSAVFDSVPDLLVVFDHEGRVVRTNPRWEEVLGWTTEELRGQGYRSLIHPDDQARAEQAGEERRPVTGEFENRWRARDGTYRWLAWSGRWLPDEQVFVGSARDVSRRKALEQQRRRRAEHDALLARASAALGRASRDVGAIVDEVVGQLAAHLADRVTCFLVDDGGRLVAERVHAVEAPGVGERGEPVAPDGSLGEVLRTGEPQLDPEPDPADVVAGLRPADAEALGATPVHSAMWVPLRAADRVIGVVFVGRSTNAAPFAPDDLATALDLADRAALAVDNARLFTAQAAVEAALRASEARFRSSFDNAPVGMTTISLRPETRGRYLSVNDAFCELIGYPREDLVGTDVATHVVGDDGPAALERQMRQVATGEPLVGEWRLRRADGEIRDIRSTSALVSRDGEVDHAVVHVEDVTVTKRLEEQLRRRALYDDLTGLPNRYLLMDHLASALATRRRSGGEVAVAFVDIDHFKDINDSLGHHAGDEVLRELGHRLRASVREVDTASRLAGDELVVVCPDIDGDETGASIAARLHQSLSEPVELGTGPLPISISMGIATTVSAPAEVEELLRAADTAMYHVKRHGRGRWQLYDRTLDQRARRRHLTEQLLRDALRHGWFRLHYQPVVDLTDGRVVGTEALLRLDHPEDGLRMPGEFIDVAEDSDLIVPIGEWALDEACRQTAAWTARFGRLDVAVNLSGRQVVLAQTAERVRTALATHGLDPTQLCLEVTERVLVESGDSDILHLWALADEGVQVALDDFGTGYSALAYLERLPVAVLKIDRSFVSALGHRPGDTAIVRAIAAFARELRLTTVAEGIEEPVQLEMLRTLHCDRGQGFLLHRPEPAEAVTALLAGRSTSASPAAAPDRAAGPTP